MDVELIHPADFFRLLKVAIAMALGALIGIEREAAKKPAGLRTHMLVAGAASFLVMLGNKVMIEFGSLVGAEYIGSDRSALSRRHYRCQLSGGWHDHPIGF